MAMGEAPEKCIHVDVAARKGAAVLEDSPGAEEPQESQRTCKTLGAFSS